MAQASKSDARNDEKTALLAELTTIRGEQSDAKLSRNKIREQIESLQDGIQKQVFCHPETGFYWSLMQSRQIKALQAAQAKTPFRTLADADARIEYVSVPLASTLVDPSSFFRALDKQVESGSMKLADEKRAILEISQIRRTRKTVEGFQSMQDAIDADRRAVDDLHKQLNDPESKAKSDRYEALQAKLDEIKKEADEAYSRRSKVIEERNAIQARLNALYDEKREKAQQYNDANNRYWAKVNEDRARRQEKVRLQRAAEEAQKKLETAQRLREEAALPAFQAQIEDCQTLIDALSGKTGTNVALSSVSLPSKAAVVGVPELELRKVEDVGDGLVVRKKKGEEEEAYFAGKQKKGRKDKAAKAETQLNVPLPVLRALLFLSIPAPTGSDDVPRVIEDLRTKKTWFEANQARVTAENLAKAEAEIQRLTIGTRHDNDLETSTVSRVESPVTADVSEPPTPVDSAEPAPTEPDGDANEVEAHDEQ